MEIYSLIFKKRLFFEYALVINKIESLFNHYYNTIFTREICSLMILGIQLGIKRI